MPVLHLPFVVKHSSILQDLLSCILLADWQERKHPEVNPLLMKAAQQKAEDMATRNYFSHTSPEGITPNETVRSTGYVLPEWYPQKRNNVESIALGYTTPSKAVEGWLNSPGHRVHVAGEIDFYRNQNQIGVGLALNKDNVHYWVFLSAP